LPRFASEFREAGNISTTDWRRSQDLLFWRAGGTRRIGALAALGIALAAVARWRHWKDFVDQTDSGKIGKGCD